MAAILDVKTQTHRDVLFATSCGLVGFGLFPFLHARYVRWFPGSANSDRRHDHYLSISSQTHTAFDLPTCAFGAAFALLGVGVMFLSCLLLPRRPTRACLKTVGVPLAVVAAGAAMLLHAFYTDTDLAATWRASVRREFAFADRLSSPRVNDTHVLEFQVNKHFCRALGDRVCLNDSVREAKLLFSSLQAWPAAAAPHATVVSACYDTAAAAVIVAGDSEQLVTGAVDAQLRVCRVCSSITRGAARRGPNVLKLIRSPSQNATRWCGEYLLTRRAGANLANAPFQQHRDEVLSKWRNGDDSGSIENEDEDSAAASSQEATLARSVRLLLVLVWFSLPALAIMARWFVTSEHEQWDWSVAESA